MLAASAAFESAQPWDHIRPARLLTPPVLPDPDPVPTPIFVLPDSDPVSTVGRGMEARLQQHTTLDDRGHPA